MKSSTTDDYRHKCNSIKPFRVSLVVSCQKFVAIFIFCALNGQHYVLFRISTGICPFLVIRSIEFHLYAIREKFERATPTRLWQKFSINGIYHIARITLTNVHTYKRTFDRFCRYRISHTHRLSEFLHEPYEGFLSIYIYYETHELAILMPNILGY